MWATGSKHSNTPHCIIYSYMYSYTHVGVCTSKIVIVVHGLQVEGGGDGGGDGLAWGAGGLHTALAVGLCHCCSGPSCS